MNKATCMHIFERFRSQTNSLLSLYLLFNTINSIVGRRVNVFFCFLSKNHIEVNNIVIFDPLILIFCFHFFKKCIGPNIRKKLKNSESQFRINIIQYISTHMRGQYSYHKIANKYNINTIIFSSANKNHLAIYIF